MLTAVEFEQLCLKLHPFIHIGSISELMADLAKLPELLSLEKTHQHLDLLKHAIITSFARLAEVGELPNKISLDIANFLNDLDFELLDGYFDEQLHTPLNLLAHANLLPIRHEPNDFSIHQARSNFWYKTSRGPSAEFESASSETPQNRH